MHSLGLLDLPGVALICPSYLVGVGCVQALFCHTLRGITVRYLFECPYSVFLSETAQRVGN